MEGFEISEYAWRLVKSLVKGQRKIIIFFLPKQWCAVISEVHFEWKDLGLISRVDVKRVNKKKLFPLFDEELGENNNFLFQDFKK